MSTDIALTLAIIVLTLVAFVREWAPPDVLSLTILCLVTGLGLVPMDRMSSVFQNEAPLTIAALFVIGGALEKSGAVGHIGRMLKSRLSGNTRLAMLSFSLVAAFFSAWMNNTAIVAILLPVTLGFARSKDIAASRLLMPLSYASILGGCCTLIGTSTNLIVNGSLRDLGLPPLGMFELAPVGVPMAILGITYLVIFGPRLIPARTSISGSLEIDHRATPLYHLLIPESSALVGQNLIESPLAARDIGIHMMEIRRRGARLMMPLSEVVFQANDRIMVAIHRRKGGAKKSTELFEEIGTQIISTVEGIVSELVVREESALQGRTLAAADFRQRYNCVVLALHRDGVNITSRLAKISLAGGDTLLVITPRNNLELLAQTRDFILTDSPDEDSRVAAIPAGAEIEPAAAAHRPRKAATIAWVTLFGVVLVTTLSDFLHARISFIPLVPIHYAAMVGALLLLWLRVLSPREAYSSIDWQVLLMLYGLLGLGLAMQTTGTAQWLANELVHAAQGLVSPKLLPWVLLWVIFLFTNMLTELLSNNATAIIMVPIVATIAVQMGIDSRPFIVAVTVAASTAFALPMGYQTHMMIYGPGGYKFTDFLRTGVPLNLICCVTCCTLIPLIWPF